MSKNYSNSNVISEKNHRGLFAFIVAALILVAGFDAQSQTVTNYLWNNSATNYTGNSSWTNGVAPTGDTSASSNNVIEFSNFGAGNNTVSLSSGRSVGTILFSSTANAYTFDALASTQRIGLTGESPTMQQPHRHLISAWINQQAALGTRLLAVQ